MGDRTLTIQEVARYLEVSPQAVYKWIASGKMVAVREGKVRKYLRVPLESVRNFATERGMDTSDLDSDNGWVPPCAAAA
jgi:excisionase family DNA binding protein